MLPPILRALVVVYTLLGALALGSTASAADQTKEAADAEFKAAMLLMDEGRYEEACKRFESSLELDAGMAAQFRLGECYEKLGRFASAWRQYRQVVTGAGYSGMPERERVARERAQRAKAQISWLVVEVPDEVAELPGLVVRRDGQALPRQQWGKPAAVDPGSFRIQATVDGKPPLDEIAEVQGPAQTVTVRVAWDQPDADRPPAPSTPAEPTPDTDASGLGGQTIAGIVVGAVGVAGLAVGTGLGLAAKSSFDDSEQHCEGSFCHPEGLDLRDQAGLQADVATALFSIGAAAVVAGVVLVITAPSDDTTPTAASAAVRLRLGVGPTGALVDGSW